VSAQRRGWRWVTQRRKGHGRFRCGRKWGYPTASNAEHDRARLAGRTGDKGLSVYHCPNCKGYHVGHPPKEKQYQ
jgi:hypothetical protein